LNLTLDEAAVVQLLRALIAQANEVADLREANAYMRQELRANQEHDEPALGPVQENS
jgi:hypothetical protein